MLDAWINNCLEPDREFEKVENFMRTRLFRVESEPLTQDPSLKWKTPLHGKPPRKKPPKAPPPVNYATEKQHD